MQLLEVLAIAATPKAYPNTADARNPIEPQSSVLSRSPQSFGAIYKAPQKKYVLALSPTKHKAVVY